MKWFGWVFLGCISLGLHATGVHLSTWSSTCFKTLERANTFYESAVSAADFHGAIIAFKKLTVEHMNVYPWVNNIEKPTVSFRPFVQKLVLPAKSTVAMWGDLHGSVHSLLRSLIRLKDEGYIDDTFKIIRSDFYMFFLGDFVDRGTYGVEVMYTLLQLKLANPHRVFLVRGNHEDAGICERFGFGKELDVKFGIKSNKELVYSLYEYLPVAIFLGRKNSTSFVLCCHGGIEPGFNPHQLLTHQDPRCYAWLGMLKRKNWVKSLPEIWQQNIQDNWAFEGLINFLPFAPTHPHGIGFLWNDFIDDDSEVFLKESRGCAWSFGYELTAFYMQHSIGDYTIAKIIRAHQHNGQMLVNVIKNKGIYALWNGLVYTILSAPAMGLEKSGNDFAYDSYVMVQVKDWKVTHSYTLIIT